MTSQNGRLALTNRRPGHPTTEEDDIECIICLGKFNTRSQIDSCRHQFCFACIKRWALSDFSRDSNNCPVCKKQFLIIKHTKIAEDDFIEYTVNDDRLCHTISLYDLFGRTAIKEQDMQQFHINEEELPHPFRKMVYKENKWSIPLPNASRYSDFDLHFLSFNRKQLLPLLFKFILRDIVVIRLLLKPTNHQNEIENYKYNKFTSFIIKTVFGLVDAFEIRSPSMVNILQYHLKEYTYHFCHELFNFANSLIHISKLCSYDELVQYSNHKPQNMTSNNDSKLHIMHPLWPQKPVKTCQICLHIIKNKCHINDCDHIFCFVCIYELSKKMSIPKCPVCNMKFDVIDYKSPLSDHVSYTILPSTEKLLINHIIVHDTFGWFSSITTSTILCNPVQLRGERQQMSIYKNNLWSDPLDESSSRSYVFNTALYSENQEKIYPILYQFIRRDIMAIRSFKKPKGRDASDIIELYYFEQCTDFIIDTVLALLAIFEIKSENMANALHHHLFDRTNHFINDLYNFAHSLNTVDNLDTYDALVQRKMII